jgi:hypothetical protein
MSGAPPGAPTPVLPGNHFLHLGLALHMYCLGASVLTYVLPGTAPIPPDHAVQGGEGG